MSGQEVAAAHVHRTALAPLSGCVSQMFGALIGLNQLFPAVALSTEATKPDSDYR